MSLKAEGISFYYEGARTPALCGVDLEIGKGELAVLCGKNGAGKSTLLRCLAGLARPREGRVSIDGQEARKARHRIGFAIQFPERALFGRTLRDDIAFGPANMGMPPAEIETRMAGAVDALGLGRELLTRTTRSLSHGQKRLAAIACAIAHGPVYLFLDEPAAGLDYEGRKRVTGLLKSLSCEGVTIVVASHDPLYLLPLCSRLIVLDEGRLIADGPPSPENVSLADIRSETIDLAGRLKACGMSVDETFSLEELADAIAEAKK